MIDELVLQHSQMRARPRVPKKDVANLSNWFHNHPHAILDEEAAYIQHPSDLISIVPKTKALLRNLLEFSCHFRLCSLWQKPPADPANSDKEIHYILDRHIDAFVTTIITVLGLVMLIAPLWTLAFVDSTVAKLAIITAFIFSFVILLSITTVAKPLESLAAVAA